MQVRLYLDVYPGMDFNQHLTVTNKPCEKSVGVGVKRFSFNLEIPDKEIHDIDQYLPGATAHEEKEGAK